MLASEGKLLRVCCLFYTLRWRILAFFAYLDLMVLFIADGI